MGGHLCRHQWIDFCRLQIGVKHNAGLPGLLGHQATLHGAQPQVTLAHCFVIGFGHTSIKLDQGLVLLDHFTLTDQHSLHDAA